MTAEQGAASSVPADEALLVATAEDLDRVDATLERLDSGDFDRCEVCGEPIGLDRLEHDPLLTRCPAHPVPAVPFSVAVEPEPAPTSSSEGTVAVLSPDQALPLGGEQPEG